MTWEELKTLAAEERQPVESLERVATQRGDGPTLVRLARACVREGRLVEALTHYDHAEMLDYEGAHEERRLVALHVGDFPESDVFQV